MKKRIMPKPSIGCAIFSLLVLGIPAVWSLWAAGFDAERSTASRVWMGISAAVLLIAAVIAVSASLDVGESPRRIDLGCLLPPLIFLGIPGVILLWFSGNLLGLRIIGLVLLALMCAGMVITWKRKAPITLYEEDEDDSSTVSTEDERDEKEPRTVRSRIGCSLVVLVPVIVGGSVLFKMAIADKGWSDAGRIWLAVGGAAIFFVGNALFVAAADLGDSPRRLDIGCLISFLIFLIIPGAFLLYLPSIPLGVRIVGGVLLASTVGAVVLMATRNRDITDDKNKTQLGLDPYTRELYNRRDDRSDT